MFNDIISSPAIYRSETVAVQDTVIVPTQFATTPGVIVPVNKDRFWLLIPYPGFDFQISFDGNTGPWAEYTHDHFTLPAQGIRQGEEVRMWIRRAADDGGAGPVNVGYYVVVPTYNVPGT